jgi:hypothetical protein
MRLTRLFATVLGVSLLAAPAFADPPADAPRAAAAAKQKGAKREARLVAAMKKEGISEAKAKRVVAVMKTFRTEVRGVRAEVKSAKQALRSNKDDAAAKQRLEAAKKKIAAAKQRRKTQIAAILTPAEQAKLEKLAAKHGKGKGQGKGKGKAKGKRQQKQKAA